MHGTYYIKISFYIFSSSLFLNNSTCIFRNCTAYVNKKKHHYIEQFQLFSMFARLIELCAVLFLHIFACLGNLEICSCHFHKRNILMYEKGNYSWHEIHLSGHLMIFHRITKACLNLQGRRFEHRPLCVLAVVG